MSVSRAVVGRRRELIECTVTVVPAGRNNGDIAAVRAIDPNSSSIIVHKADGSQQTLDLSRLADRHIRHGWVRTIHAAQGATADRVIAHLESFRANTVDAASAYVAISRARDHVALYTDCRHKLTEALRLRDGVQVGAIDETVVRSRTGGHCWHSAATHPPCH